MNKPVSARTVRTQLNLNNLLTVVMALALLVAFNYWSFRHYERMNLTRNKFYQLSEKTIHILRTLPEPVHVTTYLINSQITAEIGNLLKEYEYYGGKNVILDQVDPAAQPDKAEKLAQLYNFKIEENVVIFQYKDRSKILEERELADFEGMLDNSGQPPRVKDFKGEQQFTAAIQALVEGKPSHVYFLTGHGEREIGNTTSPNAYGILEARIKRDNNLTESLNLAVTTAVPEDCDVLVIAGPRTPLAPTEIDAISEYLDKHGKVVLMQDPGVSSGLETILQKYGMELQPDKVVARGTVQGVQGVSEILIATAVGTTFADHPATSSLKNLNLQMPDARSVAVVKDSTNPNAAKVTLLVTTPNGYWGETNFKDLSPTYDSLTDIHGPLALAAVYDGGEVPGEGVKVTGARLLVIGSSIFLANADIDGSGVGLDFFLNSLNWMLKKEEAIGIAPKLAQEFGLEISPLQLATIKVLAIGFLPFFSLVAGLIVWLSRRK